MKVVWGAVAILTAAMLPCGTSIAQQDFNGYPCTDDCSGHEAGYEWAEQNGITDANDCGGNSQSFIEGCESYTEEYGSPDEEEYSEEMDSDEPVEE